MVPRNVLTIKKKNHKIHIETSQNELFKEQNQTETVEIVIIRTDISA